MAMAETTPQPHDRPDRVGRRRPFSTLMRKLANLKGASSADGNRLANSKRNNTTSKKGHSKNNNPYPLSGRIGTSPGTQNSHYSFSTARSTRTSSATSLGRGSSIRSSVEGRVPPTGGTRSMAPTVSTDHETSRSITTRSHGASSLAGTSRTANGGLESRRGGDSTFSSPAPSVRSLTTTLTTIQSMAPNGFQNTNPTNTNISSHHGHHSHPSNSQVIHFDQPFPTASPASAIPAHLTPSLSTPGHPTTYSTATANNLLTDNASILTLASSSKRRRRRSLDTDASVRALAPSSLFGGSRESLPLSVLSATVDGVGPTTPGLHRGAAAAAAGAVANERTSIYSTTGILASERNSLYAKQGMGGPAGGGDGASVRSGLLGHGRADSVTGSIGGMATSPLASPWEVVLEKEKEDGRVGERVEEDEERYKPGGENREYGRDAKD
ncbi:hypothetical protein QBC33DRAFT_464214 [Phialemonium atrogriseum]|uniref:Uncharacterized protein n=1 Tax=Phialemonium atrogriseum TaxID=1093897 RepID=A0AAJ0CA20_9PEZI|nr:uncharacterized protein QBC33DRAFT_464214 [Phialemonium atrogriseum]KAK1772735.1 hypothetical protein QBC33DRAFT_464214 [Phialemonium atrogriseum]